MRVYIWVLHSTHEVRTLNMCRMEASSSYVHYCLTFLPYLGWRMIVVVLRPPSLSNELFRSFSIWPDSLMMMWRPFLASSQRSRTFPVRSHTPTEAPMRRRSARSSWAADCATVGRPMGARGDRAHSLKLAYILRGAGGTKYSRICRECF